MNLKDALVEGIEGCYYTIEDLPFTDDYTSCVVKVSADGTRTIVGTDGGEPEDQTLTRDWSWVIDELNNAVKEANELR